MNRTSFIFISLTLLLTAGCKTTRPPSAQKSNSIPKSPSTAPTAAPDKTAQLITTFGEYRVGNTIVEANKSERKITVKHLSQKEQPFGGKSTSFSSMSPPPKEWPLHDGWFAYAHENGAYVWLYNGKDKMLVVERKESAARNETNTYGPQNAPIPIPSAVLKHIKEPLRSKLLNQ